MSALGDTLETKNREFVAGAKLIITVDAATTEAEPSYSIRLEAPSYSEVLLEAQTALEAATALTEFTDWATAAW